MTTRKPNGRTILLAAHGGGSANARVAEVATEVKHAFPGDDVRIGFQLGSPSLSQALDGVDSASLCVLPLMAADGFFVDVVLPNALAPQIHPSQSVRWLPPTGSDSRLRGDLSAAAGRTLTNAGWSCEETCFLVVGHGTRRHPGSQVGTLELAGAIQESYPSAQVRVGFLDQEPFAEPAALSITRTKVVVVPHLMGGGDHHRRDLRELFRSRPDLQTRIAPAISELASFCPRIIELLSEAESTESTLRVGTRGSRMAMQQAARIARTLEAGGERAVVQVVTTTGDRDLTTPISEFSTDGPFSDELRSGLLERSIDVAVHCLKDLPWELPEEFEEAAFLPRAEVRDVWIGHNSKRVSELPTGTRVGCSSRRRRIQLQALFPGLDFVPMRGAVDARVRAIAEGEFAGAVFAEAGLHRLGMERAITEPFPLHDILPAPGQGVVTLECRVGDAETVRRVRPLHDAETELVAAIEIELAATVARLAPDHDLAVLAHKVGPDQIAVRMRLLSAEGIRWEESRVGDRDQILSQCLERIGAELNSSVPVPSAS